MAPRTPGSGTADSRFSTFTSRLLIGLLVSSGWLLLAASGQAAGGDTPQADARPLQDISIGIRAHQGAEMALQRWRKTADYLSRKIPGYRFRIVPFENNIGLREATSRNEFEFVLTQPAAFVEYQIRYGVEPLVTLVNKRQGKGYDRFGSVIFTRASRSDINRLRDLKGKSFMGVAELGFGGWIMAWGELLSQDIQPYRDFKPLMFGGGIQQNVVRAVLESRVDAGSVRTDLLEQMAARGEISLAQIKVINAHTTAGFPFVHSTPLYPEWPLARLSHTDPELAEKVQQALLAMSPLDPAAQAGNYVGWTRAHDYASVHQLLKRLNVGPYAIHGDVGIAKIIEDYWPWVIVTAVGAMLACITIARMKLLNERLRSAESQLLASNRRLRDLARQDGLTGLANRHRLDEFLKQAWSQASRNRGRIAVILLDIDFFKQYNDSYGHLQGDECLRQVAAVMQRLFRRAGDLTVRYGGEEFLVVLNDIPLARCIEQAESLRRQVEALQIPHRSSPVTDHVTVSLGIAQVIATPEISPDSLIEAADRALYQAKKQGRNRVVASRTDAG
jgi:diguanylate cyclase (GGDEF)-like protein